MKTEEQKASASAAVEAHPAMLAKRKRDLAGYVCSVGHVPNPDASDWRRPGVTPEEAKEISSKLKPATK